MGLGSRIRGGVVCGAIAVAMAAGALAQTVVTITEPAGPLLPGSFGEWKAAGTPIANLPAYSLTTVNKAALEECGPERSAVKDYVRGGKTLHVEAVQFGDRTGAYSAFTLVERAGMETGSQLGTDTAMGDGAVLFTAGTTVVLVSPATAADVAALKPLALGLPKVVGNKGVAPLLPALVLSEDLVKGSVRYALGAETYAAEGGVLPANSLGWDKSAEAVTAQYANKGKQEALTLLLYPTPEIAAAMTKTIQGGLGSLGPGFAAAKVRREGELVVLASGGYAAEDAERMVNSVHLRQQVSMDKTPGPEFHAEVHKTFSLLVNILVLSGLLMAISLTLAIFFGGGRALVRVLQGKPAAAEPEFLSLHLAPQNKPAEFGPRE
jgi:hypothetical protein